MADPELVVYRAETDSIVCYRGVRNAPAQPGDFVSFAESRASYQWWNEILAIGVSAWDTPRAAAAATRNRFPYIATLDLAVAHPEVKWAATRTYGHVTLWAPAPVLLDSVVGYTQSPTRK